MPTNFDAEQRGRGGRPCGELRIATRAAYKRAGEAGEALTWRELATVLHARGLMHVDAPSELRMLRRTVCNMVQAGELAPAVTVAVPGSRRAMTAYRLTTAEGAASAAASLGALMAAWVR